MRDLQPSSIDWDSLENVVDRSGRRLNGGHARRLDRKTQQVAKKTCFIWLAAESSQGAERREADWIDFRAAKSRGPSRTLLNIAELESVRPVGDEQVGLPFGHSASKPVDTPEAALWRRTAEPVKRSARNPGPACAAWPEPTWCGPGLRLAPVLGRNRELLSAFLAVLRPCT